MSATNRTRCDDDRPRWNLTGGRVWKFGPLVPGFEFVAEMPHGAIVRYFAEFDGLHFWAQVEPSPLRERRVFVVVGTGWDVKPGVRYHGTVIDGEFVWHLFEAPARVPAP